MKTEIIIGLSIFAVSFLYVIQLPIRHRSEKVKQQRLEAFAEFKARREEVERKARRQL